MKFGRLSNLEVVDFSLPPIEDALLGWGENENNSDPIASSEEALQLYVGAPVWAHKSFLGKIYPPKLKAAEFLTHYARNFNCIELNSTFYGVPSPDRIAHWRSQVGPGFRFCPKATRSITHGGRGLPREEVAEFFRSVGKFGDNLGISFFQFPPEFGPPQWRHLRDLLRLFPRDFHVAVELRHPGWFEKRAALEWLMQLGVETATIFVITDTAGRRDVLHNCLPLPQAFVRFSGDALAASDFERLDQWVLSLRALHAQGLREAYFIVHQETEGNCVELAEHLALAMPEVGLPSIERVKDGVQLPLW